MVKEFKTLDQQIEILKEKGLVIDDELTARDILLRESYFFLSGYRHLFLISSTQRNYIPNTNFRELYAMFNFDRQVRNIIFKNMLIIENNIKSIFAYQMAKKYGYKEDDYMNPKNFDNSPDRANQLNDLLRKMKRQVRVNGTQHTATSHYMANYGYIPPWVVVKVLSFGIVSELYTVLKKEDQEDIASIYNMPVADLLTYLPILANYRNLCAHEDIVYDHKTQRQINDTKYHEKLNIPKNEDGYVYGKDDIFALIIIMKRLLREEEFTLLINELDYEISILEGKLKVINIEKVLNVMGIPLNYEEISRMER